MQEKYRDMPQSLLVKPHHEAHKTEKKIFCRLQNRGGRMWSRVLIQLIAKFIAILRFACWRWRLAIVASHRLRCGVAWWTHVVKQISLTLKARKRSGIPQEILQQADDCAIHCALCQCTGLNSLKRVYGPVCCLSSYRSLFYLLPVLRIKHAKNGEYFSGFSGLSKPILKIFRPLCTVYQRYCTACEYWCWNFLW